MRSYRARVDLSGNVTLNRGHDSWLTISPRDLYVLISVARRMGIIEAKVLDNGTTMLGFSNRDLGTIDRYISGGSNEE